MSAFCNVACWFVEHQSVACIAQRRIPVCQRRILLHVERLLTENVAQRLVELGDRAAWSVRADMVPELKQQTVIKHSPVIILLKLMLL